MSVRYACGPLWSFKTNERTEAEITQQQRKEVARAATHREKIGEENLKSFLSQESAKSCSLFATLLLSI